jgi:dihydrodipicolinate reductase
MRLVVVGAAGRMGRTLVRAVCEAQGCELSGALERPGSIALGEDPGLLAGVGKTGLAIGDDPAVLAEADGVLDFTSPAATVRFAEEAARHGLVHVVGTTGLSEDDLSALRGGTVVGEHSVVFAGPQERIELAHRAEDRAIFANGALRAALWARERPPGYYTMADVLGLADL